MIGLTLVAVLALGSAYGAACDRACLKTTLDQYLNAVVQHTPGVAMSRNLLAEWFYIEQGKIRSIYAAMYYPDQEAMVPNWPPYDGNWPVAPAVK